LRDAQDEQRRAWAELYQDEGLVFCHENRTPTIRHRFQKQIARAQVNASASTTSGIHRR